MGQVILMRKPRNKPNSEAPVNYIPDPVRMGNREYSRGEISRGTGLSLSHVSRIFNSQRLPSVQTLQKLANFFNVGADDVLAALIAVQHRDNLNQGLTTESGPLVPQARAS